MQQQIALQAGALANEIQSLQTLETQLADLVGAGNTVVACATVNVSTGQPINTNLDFSALQITGAETGVIAAAFQSVIAARVTTAQTALDAL